MKAKIMILIALYIFMVMIVIWGVTSESLFGKMWFGFLFIVNIFNIYKGMKLFRR